MILELTAVTVEHVTPVKIHVRHGTPLHTPMMANAMMEDQMQVILFVTVVQTVAIVVAIDFIRLFFPKTIVKFS